MADTGITSPWLTAKEAAEYLRVDPRTLRQWCREGRVPFSRSDDRHNGRLRFHRGRLDEWLLTREEGTA